MKISKFLLGFALIIFAAIGAYATAKNTAFAQVFYEVGGTCFEGDAEQCLNDGQVICDDVSVETGTGTIITTIYQAPVSTTDPTLGCKDPYTRLN